MAKDAMKFVGENMDTIVTVGMNVLKFFALWKASILLTKAYMIGYNIVYGINNALQQKSLFYTEGNIVAKRADAIATGAMTTATTLSSAATAIATGNMAALNAIMLANPIGAVVVALGLLVAAFYGASKAVEAFQKPYNEAFERKEAIRKEAFAVQDLRDKYLALGKTLKESEEMAVNSVKRNTLNQITEAKLKLDSLDPEVRQQGVNDMAQIAEKSSRYEGNSMLYGDNGQRFANSKELGTLVASAGTPQQVQSYDWGIKPSINPKLAQTNALSQTITKNTNSTLIIKNESDNTASLNTNEGSQSIMPKTSSTTMLSAH
jgi:hypothetical protein